MTTQQAVDLALSVNTLLQNNWSLGDELDKKKFEWFSFEPTRTEIREKPLVIAVTFESGTGEPTSLAVSQMKDLLKIDVFLSLRNLEGNKQREKREELRMIVKNEILAIIHDNQTETTGIKFSKYVRSVRSDEVESADDQWYLHEILFIQAGWYHTES